MLKYLLAAALGAALAYFLDPDRGARRRNIARDRVLAAARRNCDVVLSFTEGTSGESGERGSYQMVAEPAAGMPIPLGAPRRFEALFLQKSKDRLGFNFRGMPANSSGSLELTDHRGRVRSIAMSKYGRVALK